MIEEAKGPIDPKVLKRPLRHLEGEAKWKDIEDIVKRWERRKPQEAASIRAYAKSTREGLKDVKYGMMGGRKETRAVGGGGTRIGVVIHPELLSYIQAFHPTFLDTKEDLHEFKKRFPAFRIPEA